MVYVFKTKDKNGKQHDRWRFQYTDWQGKRKGASGTTSRKETEKLAARVQADQESIKKGWKAPPKKSDAPRSFRDTADEYLDWGSTQGGRKGRPWSDEHHYKRKGFLEWWENRLGLRLVSDLEGCLPRVEKALRELLKKGRTGRTASAYTEGIAAFCDWCVDRGYLDNDPLKGMAPFDRTPRSPRRDLSPDEIKSLLKSSPPERQLVYITAICSGLRANELRSLRMKHLDTNQGGLHLEPEWTKARKPGFQPLPTQLVHKLVVQGKKNLDPETPLLEVPVHQDREFNKDIKAAGIPKQNPRGIAVFHSLRNTFCTLVDQAGATPAEGQAMARHASLQMTYSIYTKTRSERLKALAEQIGGLFLDPESTTPALRQAAGAESPYVSKSYVVGVRGFEPPASTTRT